MMTSRVMTSRMMTQCTNTPTLIACRATSRLFYFSNVAVNVFIYAGRSGDFRMALTYDWYRVKTCCGLKPENRPRHPSATSSRYDVAPDVVTVSDQVALSTGAYCASGFEAETDCGVHEQDVVTHL